MVSQLSSDVVAANTTGLYYREFRYRMHVTVSADGAALSSPTPRRQAPTGAVMRASVLFDFVANDFRLELSERDRFGRTVGWLVGWLVGLGR